MCSFNLQGDFFLRRCNPRSGFFKKWAKAVAQAVQSLLRSCKHYEQEMQPDTNPRQIFFLRGHVQRRTEPGSFAQLRCCCDGGEWFPSLEILASPGRTPGGSTVLRLGLFRPRLEQHGESTERGGTKVVDPGSCENPEEWICHYSQV